MRNHAGVSRRQLRTSNYTPEARALLGEAVERARIAAGYKFRTEFCRAHGIKNLRGLELLEQGRTGVGQAFLFEVAAALPGWDETTPRRVLEGEDPPPIENQPVAPERGQEDDEWTEEDEELMELVREVARKAGVKRLRPKIVEALLEEMAREIAQRNHNDESG
jgi:hypothetical protein